MATVNSTNKVSDVLSSLDERTSVKSYKLKAPAATAMTDVEILGQPVKLNGTAMEFVLATDEANAEGIVYAKEKVTLTTAATSTKEYAVITRGPALINEDELPAADVAGTSFTVATLVTAYLGMSGDIAVKSSQDETETQTT